MTIWWWVLVLVWVGVVFMPGGLFFISVERRSFSLLAGSYFGGVVTLLCWTVVWDGRRRDGGRGGVCDFAFNFSNYT